MPWTFHRHGPVVLASSLGAVLSDGGKVVAWVAGADGFRGGWMVVLRGIGTDALEARAVGSVAELLGLPERPAVLAVDMPIGLPAATLPGGRSCDQQARRALGRKAGSVFSPVGRVALAAASRAEADRLSRDAGGLGVGAQSWGLARAMRDLDRAMTPARQESVFEVHPELSFATMQGGAPITAGKKTAAGRAARLTALVAAGFPQSWLEFELARRRQGHDDLLDACAAAWTAERIRAGTAGRFPPVRERDPRGLDMAIWF